ncbi:hypothetical protein EVAR_84772_1 [Eumeta japonica]|uniref:Kazal-like domain-containing protein n=1 Tax=Eumeta variegata TaxID=151549 RepID=A0A4C1U822_EUMVA|nr:hypothetical protein EVAR_84772_1 [Eumeta japonica]
MRALIFVLFVSVCVAVCVARPDKQDLKQVKAELARKKACMRDCQSAGLQPLCAGKTGEKPKSFGSECVLHNYNCEHNDSLHKISAGECPGSDGIRLA